MLIKKPTDIRPREITPRQTYLHRREFLATAGAAVAALATGALDVGLTAGNPLTVAKRMVTTTDPPTPYNTITTYNNFYEFGSNKSDPARNAKVFKPKPWSVAVEGACGKPGLYMLEDILKPHPLEERVYRHRCVEGWSIVVPWVGFSLNELIKRAEPLGKAKYVEFTTLYDPKQMPGQRYNVLRWPYVEGLRLDEAMHPLALLCFGLYGEVLPNQDGAPLRIVIPWKYGFKSAKSIVRIRFTDSQPMNSWQLAAPNEYGFYSNVNPNVDHPRWSQAKERRLGEFLKRPTLMFNGYDQVASLYAGMDLRKNF